MTAYRFCRSDDIGLLVDALNRCWGPSFPDEPAMDTAVFKRSIRDLQVWCSSCMVAFSGPDPIGVLIGAKRPSSTLVHRIAVHPDHRRQGHGRHLLESLGSKLAILGPPRIVAEIPEQLTPACGLFTACGFAEETVLADYVLQRESNASCTAVQRGHGEQTREEADAAAGRFVIPVSVDDLAANGLLGEVDPQVCWRRSVETLTATRDDMAGFAVASDERIEAYVLYQPQTIEADIVALGSLVDDGGSRLRQLISRVQSTGIETLTFSKVHASEIPEGLLSAVGFLRADLHRRYGATARPD